MPGIYQIRNTLNDKVYIGSTKREFRLRFNEHKSWLRNNKHTNSYLQNSWNKYGEETFSFEIVEHIEEIKTIKFLLDREQYYLDTIKPEYNWKTTAETNQPVNAGWTAKTYTLYKNGKPLTITNLAKYCRDNDLNENNLRAVANKQLKEYAGYQHTLGIHKRKKTVWKLISPEKELVLVSNLAEFCRNTFTNEVSSRDSFYRMKKYPHRWKQYKGWTLYNENEDNKE